MKFGDVLLFAALGLSVVIAAQAAETPAGDSKTKKPPAQVSVRELKAAELHDSLTYPARVISTVNAAILAETDGVVTRIAAPLGETVARNARVMTVAHTDPVYKYAPFNIVAPVAGVVSAVDVTEGSRVSRGQRLATVTDPAQVRVLVEAPAADLARLRAGLGGELALRGREDKVPVRVRGISPFVDPQTGTASCELEVLRVPGAPAVSLPPGLVGQVSFKVNVRQGFSIPDFVIEYKGKDPFVRLVEEGKMRKVAVTLGRSQRGDVEVLTGVKAGAKVIERASRFVPDGEEVVIQ